MSSYTPTRKCPKYVILTPDYNLEQEEFIIRKVILTMDENKKYEIIKGLADHPNPNKERASLILGCTVRHINRLLAGYKESGKVILLSNFLSDNMSKISATNH